MSWLALFSVPLASADCYLQFPKGHNNRLNEASANRNNANSIMDSQNNNRGGYNHEEKKSTAFDPNDKSDDPSTTTLFPASFDKDQYNAIYYAGSQIVVEWTFQHGFGGNEANDQNKLNSNYVLQYMCDTDPAVLTDKGLTVLIKNGRNTDTPDAPGTYSAIDTTKASNDANARRRHESEAYYYECTKRSRNRGLFLADQWLNGDTAIYTRQNPDGTRRGLECPEERDYYPYWGPVPWVDIAIATDTIEDCTGKGPKGEVAADAFNYIANSMNTATKYKCILPTPAPTDETTIAKIFFAINSTACTTAGGVWQGFTHATSAPACIPGEWSRVNHLGNGRIPQMLSYNWTLPQVAKGTGGLSSYARIASAASGAKVARCVLRIRYNMSSDDYDPRTTNASLNDNPAKGINSPVTNNPTVDVNPTNTGQGTSPLMALKLAINTNQFGRTFQDRSHPFFIKSKPTELSSCNGIWNLGVRGKRGNIVQTFPAVEYDFVPNILSVGTGTCIHMQWGGSNTHNNGEPAGDGQAGDAGEGTTGTDRQNFTPVLWADRNIPFPLDNRAFDKYNIIRNADCFAPPTDYLNANSLSTVDPDSCAIYLATSGYYKSITEANSATTADFSPLLNNASPSLIGGVVLKTRTPGVYHGICTRNNNFSNRSTKTVIIVS